MFINMMSQAGKFYTKWKGMKSLNKQQRQKIYHSSDKVNRTKKQVSIKKKPPTFNTVSRQCRNSFLLRVTCESNMQTNYQINYSPIYKKRRAVTITKIPYSKFIDVNQNKDNEQHRSKIQYNKRYSTSILQNCYQPTVTSGRSDTQPIFFTKQFSQQKRSSNKQRKRIFIHNPFSQLRKTQQVNQNINIKINQFPQNRQYSDIILHIKQKQQKNSEQQNNQCYLKVLGKNNIKNIKLYEQKQKYDCITDQIMDKNYQQVLKNVNKIKKRYSSYCSEYQVLQNGLHNQARIKYSIHNKTTKFNY